MQNQGMVIFGRRWCSEDLIDYDGYTQISLFSWLYFIIKEQNYAYLKGQ